MPFVTSTEASVGPTLADSFEIRRHPQSTLAIASEELDRAGNPAAVPVVFAFRAILILVRYTKFQHLVMSRLVMPAKHAVSEQSQPFLCSQQFGAT